MGADAELAYLLTGLEQRVSRLETLEQQAGAGGGDLALIETKTLDVAGILQFTSIPATYTHLFYTGFLKGVTGAQVYLLINNSGASSLSGIGVMPCGAAQAGATNVASAVTMGWIQSAGGVGVPSDTFGAIWGWIPVYLTSIYTGTMATSGAFNRDDGIQHQLTQGRGGGNFGDNTAISQIDIIHSGGTTFTIGSTFSLYGLVTV